MKSEESNPFLKYGIIVVAVCVVIQLIWLFWKCVCIPLFSWLWSCVVAIWNFIGTCISAVWHGICSCVLGIWHFIVNFFDFIFLDIFHQDSFLATVAAIGWRMIIIGVVLFVIKLRRK